VGSDPSNFFTSTWGRWGSQGSDFVYIPQNKYLGDHIPEASKKNSENQDKQGNSHVLVVIKYSPNACILYSSTPHKIFEIENVL
jgi:hypothetical protein